MDAKPAPKSLGLLGISLRRVFFKRDNHGFTHMKSVLLWP